MTIVSTPTSGDVVIRAAEPGATPRYLLRASPGPDQFGYATRAEAERMGRAYAAHAGVILWFAERPQLFSLLADFRGPVRRTRQRMEVRVGAMPARA